MVVVATNTADFLELLDVELHRRLILLRESGLRREEQRQRLEPAVKFVLSQTDPEFMVNRILEIQAQGKFQIIDVR